MGFKTATRKKLFLRMAMDGPSGSGKSITALRFAHALARSLKSDKPTNDLIAAIDTESRALSKYVGEEYDGHKFHFTVDELENFAPTTYTEKIKEAARLGFPILVIDSLSHAWAGEGGALQIKEEKGASITHWKDVTPMHNKMVNAILQYPGHVIVTMRSKVEYLIEKDEKGKVVNVQKVGVAPVQRPGMEYEFDVYASIDQEHTLKVTKTRCRALDKLNVVTPGAEFMAPLISWLDDGVPPPPPAPPKPSVSEEVVKGIVAALASLNVTMEKAKSALQNRFHVTEFGSLDAEQGNVLLAELTAKLSTTATTANGTQNGTQK